MNYTVVLPAMIDLPSPALIGVIHLKALPGAATHILSMQEIIDCALADARALSDAGFDAAIIENFGDLPFRASAIGPSTIAAMAVVADRVRNEFKLRVGINALRNDALAGLGIAATVGASFIRVNVHTGVYATDQGIIEGKAEETLQYRKLLGARVAILADVHVKHATPMHPLDITRAAKDAAYRGLADGLVVTGSATGEAVDMDHLRKVRQSVPDRRLFVGSGATAENVAGFWSHCDGVIVGSGLKRDANPAGPIDPQLAGAFSAAARRS